MTSEVTTTAEALKRYWSHLSVRRRRQGMLILLFMLVGAFAELMTIGAVLPFLALIGDPDALDDYPQVGQLFSMVGWESEGMLVPVALLFSCIAIAAAAIRLALVRASQEFVFKLGYDLSVKLYERMLYQPYSYHVGQNTSSILAGINKVQLVISNVMLPIMNGLTAITIALFIFAGLIAVNAAVAFGAAAGFGVIYLGVAITTKRRLRANSKVISLSQTKRIQTVQEGLGGIRDVLIDHAQPVYVKKFNQHDSSLRDAQAANAFIGAAPRFVVEAAGMVIIALLAVLLSRQSGGISGALPVLGALALGAQRLIPLLQQIYDGWSKFVGNRQSFIDVLGLLGAGHELRPDRAKRVEPLPFEQGICLNNVSFRYAVDGPFVLRHIDLAIPKGARIGFIGKTGSGKSTIMDLIMGLLEPVEGVMRIDGEPLDARNRAAWQAQIAHVPQAIYLSDASILENIAFGQPVEAIDRDRAAAAARKADIHAFIERLPSGYDTFVGERGIRLSGGQRQRIGIARALYKQSKVLVFDEATSALDDATEAAVMRAIEGLGSDLTVLLIAHRLSTVRNCDRIYRLDGGKVIEAGDYDSIVGGKPVVEQKAAS